MYSVVDLTDWQATRTAVEDIHRHKGRLDIPVHSAGGFPRYIPLSNIPVDISREVFEMVRGIR